MALFLAQAALPAPAHAADDALLQRFAPVLRYDGAERERATSVEALTARHLDGRGRPGDTVALGPRRHPLPDRAYGRVVRDRGRIWLQYWFLYAANPQDRGILPIGRHEGDWEVAQVRVDGRGRARAAVYAQHSWAERCSWGRVERRAGAPVVYVGHGSHASYFRSGEHGRPWPDPDDFADGRGRTVRPAVIPIGPENPGWVAWPGRWGRSTGGLVPGEQASPVGPAFQELGPWRDPAAYAARARACGTGAPPLPAAALLAAGAVAALLGAAVGARLARRR